LRATQYREALADRGLDLLLWSFLRDHELSAWFGPSQLRRIAVIVRAIGRLPRLVSLLRAASVVLVQREAMPLGPPIVEALAAKVRPVVWDVDDALWQPYVSPTAGRVPRWLRAPGAKYRRICQISDEVWAGSEVLAQWCRQYNENVAVIPTVVDVPADRPVS